MAEIRHRTVETNGIKMHIAEMGQGPLVIMCHGFPELWYSWRHQLPALAAAGFHAVAPDQRGYGGTDAPPAIEDYNMLKLTGDVVGLVHSLGEESAVIVGHDWGAPVAWNCALLRPDIFRALVLMSVPFRPGAWDSIRPTEAQIRMAGERQFYQTYFQEPGKAEREFEADVRTAMLKFLYSASGELPPKQQIRAIFKKTQTFLETGSPPEKMPSWLTEQDLDYFTKEFQRTGFRGGLNWYRNIDRNWELMSCLNGKRVTQPTLFVAGDYDGVIVMNRAAFDTLETSIPNLRKKVLLPGVGHWTQQERPDEVNRLLIEFLTSL